MDAARQKEDIHQASRVIQENLAEGVDRVQARMEERMRRGYDQTRGAVGSLNQQLETFVRESPLVAIAGAFAVGYLFAKVARSFT